MLTILFSICARLQKMRRVFSAANDNARAECVFREFTNHLSRRLTKGKNNICSLRPPSVKMV